MVLIVWVMADLLVSSMQSGEGRLSLLIHRPLYAALHRLASLTGRRGVLAWSGAVLVVGTLCAWITLTWLGWSLVFWSVPGSIVGSAKETAADAWDVVYFVGYTLGTLGLGDLKPIGNGWRILTDLASLNGFFLITFGISFVVPTAQAQAARRIFALRLYRLGPTAQDLVVTGWHDHPGGLQGLLSELAAEVNVLDAQHKNAPSLHRFHDHRAEESLERSLPALDEALSLIEFALDMPPTRGLRAVRASLSSLLDTYRRMNPSIEVDAPPIPDLTPLRRAGLPVRPDAEVQAAFAALEERRRLLRAMTERGRLLWAEVETVSEGAER